MPYEVHAKLYGAEEMGPEACKEAMFLIGSEAGIERKYVNPSRAFIDSLSVDMQSVMIYGLIGVLSCLPVFWSSTVCFICRSLAGSISSDSFAR